MREHVLRDAPMSYPFECFDDSDGLWLRDCDEPHDLEEVLHVRPYADGPPEGDDSPAEFVEAVTEACDRRLAEDQGSDRSLVVVVPTATGWSKGARIGSCAIAFPWNVTERVYGPGLASPRLAGGGD